MQQSTARASRLLGSSAIFVLLLGASGCGLPAKVTRDITPAAVDSGLKAMDDPATKKKMEHLLASPEMQDVEKALVAGVVDNSLSVLSDEDRAKRITALSSRYANVMLQGFTRDVMPQISPAVMEMTRGAVKGAMSEAFKPENQQEMTAAVSSAMTRDLGPALQKVISENLAPGIAAALQNEEVKRALGDTAHLLGREMVLGVNEGMMKAQELRGDGDKGMLGSLGVLASKGASIATGITWVLAALVVVLGGLLVKLLMQARKFRAESEESKAETRLMNEAKKASEGKPWSGELIAALEDRFHSTDRSSKPGRRAPDSHVGH
jgi:hypothetical protein